MSLPLNTLSATPVVSTWLAPDDIVRADSTVDYELGGIALSDPSQGLRVQSWRARVSGSNVLAGPTPYTSESTLFTAAGISELSVAFDQNMRPAIAYIQAGQAKLWWFDSFVATQVTTTLASDIVSVYLTTDDKRDVATQVNTNDVLLFYVRSSKLYYRQQRDRFATERELKTFNGPSVSIKRCGMTAGLRVQIECVGVDA